MTPLVKFLLVNGIGGFLTGLWAGLGFIVVHAQAGLFSGQPLATAMLLWAFGASFSMGAIGTGVAFLPYR